MAAIGCDRGASVVRRVSLLCWLCSLLSVDASVVARVSNAPALLSSQQQHATTLFESTASSSPSASTRSTESSSMTSTQSAPVSASPSHKVSRFCNYQEARRWARAHGFSNRDEFLEYSCPGAYRLPKNPDEVWPTEWESWEDFLGIPYEYAESKRIVQEWKLASAEEYASRREAASDPSDASHRLPHRPDLYYRDEWTTWEDWLGC
jgi:hypothetical protein